MMKQDPQLLLQNQRQTLMGQEIFFLQEYNKFEGYLNMRMTNNHFLIEISLRGV